MFLFKTQIRLLYFFFFSSRRRHTRWTGDWSSDVCSSDLVFQGTVNNCFISDNRGSALGGAGAHNAFMNNCTVISNRTSSGVSASAPNLSSLTNCIVYFNIPVNYSGPTFSYCCTTPLPAGEGNISAAPQLFTDSIH